MEYFRQHPETEVTHASQIAIVGDRLTTDIMMANSMGAYAIWVRDGVVLMKEKSMVSLSHAYQAASFSDESGIRHSKFHNFLSRN